METLESRQMFSTAAPVDTAALAPTAAAADPNLTDIVVTTTTDKSSPTLFRSCCTGTHLPTVVIRM